MHNFVGETCQGPINDATGGSTREALMGASRKVAKNGLNFRSI